MDDMMHWEARARDLRIDPQEVRLVFNRYAARLRYAEQRQIEPIALEQWFRFYHMEKTTEGQQAEAVPGGFPAESDAVDDGACITRPREFLELLRAYAQEQDPG